MENRQLGLWGSIGYPFKKGVQYSVLGGELLFLFSLFYKSAWGIEWDRIIIK